MKPEYVPLVVAAVMLVVAGALLFIVVTRHRRRLRELVSGGRSGTAQAQPTDELDDTLDQIARRVESRLDEKMAELQRLLADADARIAQLRHLTPPEDASADSSRPPGTDLTGRHEEILRLHSQGMDAVRIARRMEMDVGEVDLVLNLHRQQTRASGRGQH